MGMIVPLGAIAREARRLRAIGDRARDLGPAWPGVGNVISGHMAQQFFTQGAAGGRPWQPLSPRYRTWKIRKGHPAAILVLSGDLARSLTSRPMSIEEYHPKWAEFGTRDPKGGWHQRGHRLPTRLPKREILFKNPRLSSDVADRLADYIFRGRV